ncbi:MAG: T9SS C-terminal target domain-containing protein [Balneola sp.]|nr:MAG: T9SS C-terminal target domain-containing protein [Balneola sp.]
MRKLLLSFGVSLLLFTSGYGQTLSAGDIAIIGVGVDDEEVLLVALTDISSGESVFITDEEWGGSAFNSGEGFYEWVTPSISAGDVFTFATSGVTGVDGGSQGTVTSSAGSFALGNNGDGVFIYQTSTNVYNTGTYTILGFAGESSSNAGTLTGTGLTEGTDAVYFGGDNGIYNGTRTGGDQSSYQALIYSSSNWTTSGSSQTFDDTSFEFSSGSTPAKFAVTTVNNSNSPTADTSFDVVIELQDSDDEATNATQDTSVTLSLATGNGNLGGTLTGTISSGSNSVTISGVTYDTAESGVSITATNTGGSLTAGTSSTFTVLEAATKLVIQNFPTSGATSESISEFTVEIQRADDSVDLNSSASVSIAVNSGSGNLSGTSPVSASSGVATFSDISFDTADDYTVTVTSSGLTSATSSTITISTTVSPSVGSVFITEVADADTDFNAEFIEFYNSGSDAVTLSTADLLMYDNTGTTLETTFDIENFTGSTTIPANGFLIISRGATESEFETEWGTLQSNTNFSEGSSSAFFGTGRRWVLQQSGSAIDSTTNGVGSARDFQFPVGSQTFITGTQSDATPGQLDGEQDISGDAGWRLLSIPKTSATGADISDDGLGAQFTSDTDSATIYTYDDTGSFEAISSDASTLTDGYGLAVYFFDNTDASSTELPITLDVVGTEPSSDVSVTLYNGAANRFTLVGNPFATNYNTNSISATGGDISDNISFWDDASGSYSAEDRTASSGYIISPWQGFWVETSDASVTSISFPTSGKTSSDTTGTSFSKELYNKADISFTLSSENSFDEAIRLAFRGYATEEFDRADATKLIPMAGTYSTMAFKSNDILKAVESLPYDLTEETTINMEQQLVGVSGEFTLDWSGLESIPENWELMFHDYEVGTNVDMRAETSYTFEATSESSEKVNPLSILTGAVAQAQKSKSEDGIRFAITITPNTTSVSNETGDEPIAFELEQNYPNPFNPSTTINYTVASMGKVTLNVYNLMGQKVAELVNATKTAGSYNVSWDASGAASGMYIYRLEAGGQIFTRKMTLIK